jgi:hypothetical protein
MGMYWIAGSISDPDGKGTEGRQVVFYKDSPLVGYADDLAVSAGTYTVNAYEDWRMAVAPGTYKVAIVKGTDNYGADPVDVTVSGNGYDIAPQLVLAFGKGIAPPPPPGTEPAPGFKIWFGKRLYQPAIYGRKEDGKKQFVVSEKGNIKIEVDIPNPFLLNESTSYTMSIQSPMGVTTSFDLSALAGVKASAAGIKPLIIETNYPEDLRAVEDESVYTFTFNAASRGTFGAATSVTTACAVTVMGGPTKMLDIPIAFPSPLHLKTDREAYFQYTLSKNANVDIYIYDISARMVKKFVCNSGTEGGNAGVNKVKWDLITDQGSLVASGIYVMTFVERDSGKLLSRGKFTALP